MKKILIAMMLLVATLSFVGCMPSTANKVQTSTEKVWPSEISQTVPKLDEQKIKDVKKMPTSTLVRFENMTEADYDAYITEVEKNGWEVFIETSERSKGFKKGDERLDVTYLEGAILLDYVK
ncbi:MAG: hypothetical protein AB9856_15950 [Cellulosilyticaceae bacterium]